MRMHTSPEDKVQWITQRRREKAKAKPPREQNKRIEQSLVPPLQETLLPWHITDSVSIRKPAMCQLLPGSLELWLQLK